MLDRISLYRPPTSVADAAEIATWLHDRVDVTVEMRDRFLETFGDDTLPREFAEARVLSPYDEETGNTMVGIIRYEERAIDQPDRAGGVIYDGAVIQRVLNERLPTDETSLDHLHVVLLDRVVGTWGKDGRWHKRVNVLGQPALVSVPGLYEAPAKPKAYYRKKQKHALFSGDTPPREVLENEVEGEFLIEDDPRTTQALKGYVLQAVHFLETGNAFCQDTGCRLYNAHHQEELIEAQLRDPELCATHAEMYG